MRRKITKELIAWKERSDHKCVLLSGARQTGKTYITREFAREHYPHHVYIDLSAQEKARSIFDDDLTIEEIIRRMQTFDSSFELVPNQTLIILDEIQECPRARAALKTFASDGRFDVIAAGSLLGLHLRNVPQVPVGYVERMYMNPLDFEEFLWAIGISEEPISYIRECIKRLRPLGDSILGSFMKYLGWYMLVGGMPAVVKDFVERKTFDNTLSIQRNILADYRDDIEKYAEKNEILKTGWCLGSVGPQLAKENRKFMYSRIETDDDRIRGADYYNYALRWLDLANITLTCNNVSSPTSPMKGNIDLDSFKLYMRDVGLLSSGFGDEVRFGILETRFDVDRGAITENLIATMMAYQGMDLMYFRRDRNHDGVKDRMEIDFLMEDGNGPIAIKVKSGSNRNCRSLNKVMDRFNTGGIMFETRDIFVDDKGVRHYPLFAAAFMDEIAYRPRIEANFDEVEGINSRFTKKE